MFGFDTVLVTAFVFDGFRHGINLDVDFGRFCDTAGHAKKPPSSNAFFQVQEASSEHGLSIIVRA